MLSALRYPSAATLAPPPAAPLRCLVVDADPQAAAALAACVQQVPQLALAASCTSAAQALAHLRTQPVEVLFLPLELPLLAGLELLQAASNGPAVVLTSSVPDYSLQGYGTYGGADYLLKPFCAARFQQIAGRLQAQRPAAAPAPAGGLFAAPATGALYFWASQQLVQVPLAEVLYLEDLGGRTRLQTLHQELLVDESFATLAGQLPEPQFLRISPTCTVALRHAKAADGHALAVGGRRLPVGAALQDEILARVFQTSLWGA